MAKIEAVIFDLDGTLVSVGRNYSYIQEFHMLFRRLLCEFTGRDCNGFSGDRLYDTIRLPYRESVRILRSWGVRDPASFWRALEREDLEKRKSISKDLVFPYPDAKSLLGELAGNGMKLGVLTNVPEPIARLELEKAGFLEKIHSLRAFRYNDERSKPSGWGIRSMLNEWGIPGSRAWMFGDDGQDVVAGRDAGVWTGQVIRKEHPVSVSEEPDVRGSNLLELWRKANEM